MPSMKPARESEGKTYWRSLSELADKPAFRAFVEREFPQQASEWLGGGESRRTFLKVMGASVALAGLASCRRWPEEVLAPYAHRPADRMDGVAVHYATAFERGGLGFGVVAVSYDGRPIKVDGNPTHPLTMGASDAYTQASILNVYDPDRSRGPVRRQDGRREEQSWGAFETVIRGIGGAGLVVLAEASRSPSAARLRGQLIESGARWFEYEVVSNDNQREGVRRYAGRPLSAVPLLDEAAVIVSIDADLFGGEPLAVKYSRDFAAGRMLRDSARASEAVMNRLYVVESGFSITGAMADHRRGVKPSRIRDVLAEIGQQPPFQLVSTRIPNRFADSGMSDFVAALLADIRQAQTDGRKVVFVAGHRQPPEVHAVVAALNARLDAPVRYYEETEDPRPAGGWTPHAAQLRAFVEAAGAAGTRAVLIIGANPVLTAPGDVAIADVLRGDRLTIHAGTHADETAQLCQWHVPLAHYLEAWGDVRAHDGTVSIAQPLIEPIFGARSTIQLLSLLLGGSTDGLGIVKQTARETYMGDRFSDWTWKTALHSGVVEGTAWAPVTVSRNMAGETASITALDELAGTAEGYELALYAGAAHDGRYANNAWLMELPDPMTRVSWENPLIMSPKTARDLGVRSDDVVAIDAARNANDAASSRTLEAAVYVLPGHPDGSFTLAVGYGRRVLGSIADGVGIDAYALRGTAGWLLRDVKLTKVSDKRRLVACVQDHHVIDKVGKDRLHTIVPELVVEGTLEQYRRKPALGARKILALSIYNEYRYDKDDPLVMAKWGMAIDLTACTGCAACVVACQAENNIPVVGREMVNRGREMHWLRIDRYFKFPRDAASGRVLEDAAPQVVHQPLLCMHCENAPCEEVCPVAATSHSHEGLNMMTYNRCIGTRYCSNNCPYKVRRFNFFDYNAGTLKNLYTPNLIRSDLNELARLQKNPNVTVRSRGVMEKCTFCVQRIETARIGLLAKNRRGADKARFQDGVVVTACQQACPAHAIEFGDLNDPDSRVSRLHALAQSYGMLDPELNTKPRLRYLAKVRNNTGGVDGNLYNPHTATQGWHFQKGAHDPAADGAPGLDPAAPGGGGHGH